MSICISGYTGFVGSHLKRYLEGQQLTVETINLRSNQKITFSPNVQTVIHLAGKAHDTHRKQNNKAYYQANTLLSKKMFDAFLKSKAQHFITLSSVIDEVGKDVVRFIMLTRKNDASLDFDLEKVVEQSRDNPVFYVQYAHARSCSVLKHSKNEFPDMDLSIEALEQVDLSQLNSEGELSLIRRLCEWPRLLESAGEAHEPHRIAFYLYDLAGELHGLWTKGKDNARLRFIVTDDQDLTQARMALVKATSLVIASGLDVFGIEPAKEMR